MAKRGRSRKSLGGTPPPPDRKSFEQQPRDPPPVLNRLRIEHLRFETFERPKIEQAEQAQKRKIDKIERTREQARKQFDEWTERRRPTREFGETRQQGAASEAGVADILVPMRCAANKTPFMLGFKWLGAVWGSPETIITNASRGQARGSATSFSLDKMDFRTARCACRARCSPILCGSCREYLCDGGVEMLPNGGRMHHCACGHSGLLQSSLKEVSGSKSAGAQAPGNTAVNLLQLPFKGS